MTIFAVIPTRDEHKLAETLRSAEAAGQLAYLALPRGEYLVSFKGTSVELSNLLGITDGENGLGLVLAISSYYGRASTDTWEWVKTHWEA